MQEHQNLTTIQLQLVLHDVSHEKALTRLLVKKALCPKVDPLKGLFAYPLGSLIEPRRPIIIIRRLFCKKALCN